MSDRELVDSLCEHAVALSAHALPNWGEIERAACEAKERAAAIGYAAAFCRAAVLLAESHLARRRIFEAKICYEDALGGMGSVPQRCGEIDRIQAGQAGSWALFRIIELCRVTLVGSPADYVAAANRFSEIERRFEVDGPEDAQAYVEAMAARSVGDYSRAADELDASLARRAGGAFPSAAVVGAGTRWVQLRTTALFARLEHGEAQRAVPPARATLSLWDETRAAFVEGLEASCNSRMDDLHDAWARALRSIESQPEETRPLESTLAVLHLRARRALEEDGDCDDLVRFAAWAHSLRSTRAVPLSISVGAAAAAFETALRALSRSKRLTSTTLGITARAWNEVQSPQLARALLERKLSPAAIQESLAAAAQAGSGNLTARSIDRAIDALATIFHRTLE